MCNHTGTLYPLQWSFATSTPQENPRNEPLSALASTLFPVFQQYILICAYAHRLRLICFRSAQQCIMYRDLSTDKNSYSIEDVARITGLTKRTLRYYEEVGLLPPTDRTESNYRLYSSHDITRLEQIKKLRDLLGFSLAEIRELLQEADGQVRTAHPSNGETHICNDAAYYRVIRLIEQRISELEHMRSTLLTRLKSQEYLQGGNTPY
ncbi:DNA-binding transcriptional MerR regulator [Thermosporothrix hazakensis]|uniref:DNA-binding transcriptional MerR regulator n=2 Tax=Thermosporothrix hazakensis TaxID=644383 RepID=A0A326UTZ2_THEHA|nr:DNA-binding transcriptional MerR regulator [Thermosporothrix hazakensis]